jgi:hypothetical protein
LSEKVAALKLAANGAPPAGSAPAPASKVEEDPEKKKKKEEKVSGQKFESVMM